MSAPAAQVVVNVGAETVHNHFAAAPSESPSSVATAVPVAATAATAAAPKRKRAHGTGSVCHDKGGKWYGQYPDVSQRDGKRPKRLHTKCFDTEAEAHEALEALVASTEARKAERLHARAQELDHTRDLPLRPKKAADAEPNTAYYGEKWRREKGAEVKAFEPDRYVRYRDGNGGFRMFQCCRHGIGALHACTNKVDTTGDVPFCGGHGGGPKVGEAAYNRCSHCRTVQVSRKRRRSQGGKGLCAGCEARIEDEAAAEAAARAGQPLPAAATKRANRKEHELEMLRRLINAGYVESTTKGVAPRPGEFTREVYFDYRCALAREFDAGEKRYAYVDFVVHPKGGGKLVFLEIDEGEHKGDNYELLCDTTRMWNVCTSVKLDGSGDKNVLWLRVNPNTRFAIGDAAAHGQLSNTARCDAVCALLETLKGHPDDPPMAVAYAFYQLEADGATPKLVDRPDYHAQVKRAVLPLAHVVSADGRSVRLGPFGTALGGAPGPSSAAAAALLRKRMADLDACLDSDADADDDAW